ncbi:nitroreductase [Campylobacter pinnipediorum subsp. pinnipediorum]|uniref:NAD(P)H-dependent oxidoreductase n=1 Tax=Campylobacter pinnipediorum TaxID=1965231 RepID=UPI0009954A21|nr:NAD(P)H-dependent oxidoreductase [Campylobacter pinnipediorum]AQW85086.1 nitroreductase [Campylobacter pinnipediorum subsp. pinnipediorum]
MQDYLDILKFRHATKIFDENKKVSDDDINYILEAGRLSPSSMGFEPWDFLVVENKELRKKIQEKSHDQKQVTTSSHLILILSKLSELKSDGTYVEQVVGMRLDKNEEEKAKRVEFYRNFLKNSFKDEEELLYTWAHAQAMFAATNIMNAAAFKGIDSCPMEGLDKVAVGEILGLDPRKHRIAIMLPVGYHLNEQPTKYRRDIKNLVSWIK